MMSLDNPIKFKCLQPTNKKNVHALLLNYAPSFVNSHSSLSPRNEK